LPNFVVWNAAFWLRDWGLSEAKPGRYRQPVSIGNFIRAGYDLMAQRFVVPEIEEKPVQGIPRCL